MSATREEVLARIRSAISPQSINASEDYERIHAAYLQTGTRDAQQRADLFTERLDDYGARVHRTTAGELARTIAAVLRQHHKQRIVIPRDLPHEWLPEDFEFVSDQDLDYSELDRADGVITACAIAIALTGTIVLQDAPGQGRRALSLIPDYHLCIVRLDQLLETVPEAIRFLHKTCLLATTTISGPSATADIEMTRIKGVHGPRELEVILVV